MNQSISIELQNIIVFKKAQKAQKTVSSCNRTEQDLSLVPREVYGNQAFPVLSLGLWTSHKQSSS